jgi:hypothetical protein
MIKKILDNIFSDTGEFVVRFIFAAVFMSFFISNCLAQTTFTDEEIINLENDFIYLENKVDSLSYQDSLKTILITTLEDELKLTNEELEMTNEQLELSKKKTKLVKPSWWENKWLYFGYGATLGYAVTALFNQIGNISDKL